MFTAGWRPKGFGDGPLVPAGASMQGGGNTAPESQVAVMTASSPSLPSPGDSAGMAA